MAFDPVESGSFHTATRLRDPVPWEKTIDGAALLDEIASTLRRFVVLPAGAAEAQARACASAAPAGNTTKRRNVLAISSSSAAPSIVFSQGTGSRSRVAVWKLPDSTGSKAISANVAAEC